MQKPQITNSKSQINHKSKNPKQFWSLGLRSLGIIWNLVLGIWNFQKREAQNGFTLLETIVAFAVIFAALIGPVSLITRGLIDVTFAKNKLIALNLAQEGIELVRLTRDNNVLCDFVNGGTVVDWDQDPGGGSKLDPPSAGATDLEADMDSLDNMASPQNCPAIFSPDFSNFSGSGEFLKQDSNGFYQYGSGSNSPFKRKISIETLTGPDRMRITSEITWTERGRTRTVTLRDALYNWK